ncbi:hypothetical protein [Bradyrhizobium liaoningense]
MLDATMTKLTLDSLREMLQQAGFSVEPVSDSRATIRYPGSGAGEGSFNRRPGHRPAGIQPLCHSCAVSLRLGDRIVVGAAGTARLTIRGSLRINGDDGRVSGMTRWSIRKSFRHRVESEQLEFALEADLILGNGIELADVLGQGRDVYRHLRLLLADARDTLDDLPVDRAAPDGSGGPGLLVEAKLLGDLAIGRSGLVASGGAGPSLGHLRVTAAACDWLRDGLLPDIARAARAMIRRPSSERLPVRADTTTQPHPWPHVRSTGFAGNPSIVPAVEPAR